ncbi:uncharacterized protein LOC124368276, partial [Homalodisca vitripennis]|uniref:uncharacterized protein LOC124368276 n=1 Tax=Homalodisca vitripennis TaxID=197043 RepID=UPI001EEC7044
RRRKSSSPLTPAWRPPTSPKGRTRRRKVAPPSRTHSVEGLLDSSVNRGVNSPPEAPSRSQSTERIIDSPPPPSRTHSSDALLESTPVSDAVTEPLLEKSASLGEDLDTISDSVTSSSDTLKRKRNFMDRCVNKVRSLIKK